VNYYFLGFGFAFFAPVLAAGLAAVLVIVFLAAALVPACFAGVFDAAFLVAELLGFAAFLAVPLLGLEAAFAAVLLADFPVLVFPEDTLPVIFAVVLLSAALALPVALPVTFLIEGLEGDFAVVDFAGAFAAGFAAVFFAPPLLAVVAFAAGLAAFFGSAFLVSVFFAAGLAVVPAFFTPLFLSEALVPALFVAAFFAIFVLGLVIQNELRQKHH
jgi:hypothetical protein